MLYIIKHCNDMYFPVSGIFLQFVDTSMSVNTIHYIENKLEIRNLKRTSNMKCSKLDQSYAFFNICSSESSTVIYKKFWYIIAACTEEFKYFKVQRCFFQK